MDEDNFLAQKLALSWSMKTTAGSRFNAAERLIRRDKRVNIINAVASSAVIFLSVVPLATKLGDTLNAGIILVTILSSILILFTALVQFASEDAVKAERLHHCGLEIAALRRRFNLSEGKSYAILQQFAMDYDNILSRFPNHDSIDYQRYRDEHPEEFTGQPQRGKGPGGSGTAKFEAIAAGAVPIALGLLTALIMILALISRHSAIATFSP